MKLSLTDWLAATDNLLALLDFGAKFTPSTKDDELVAELKSWREKLRPVVGAASAEAAGELHDEIEVPPVCCAAAPEAISPETWEKIQNILKLLLTLAPLFLKKK